MIKNKQGWILAEAEFIQEREVFEKVQEKKKEIKKSKKLKSKEELEEERVERIIHGDSEKEEDHDDIEFAIYPEDLTPVYRKVRFQKEAVEQFSESVDNENLTMVTFKFGDEVLFLKCTIEEFDKVFFE